ncbi:hypothetical protein Q1695_008073 [Nippostrongylus brasiliensis]|nr:hypothetical protein Q1695_008073 [Nippostrongylus brasiliensis]
MTRSNNDSPDDVNSKEKENLQQTSAEPVQKDSASDQCGDDAEELLTIQDILDSEDSCRETARVLLGAQDSSVCTYPEEKDELNKSNEYNHNFAGLFCVCKKPYPCELDETMHQCVACEDWFHLSHLDEASAKIAEEREKNGQPDFSLLCKDCTSRLPFLSLLSVTEPSDDKVCFSKFANAPEGPVLLADGFRDRLCRCNECANLYERVGCEFLIDADDDIEKFTNENIEKTADEKEPDADTIVNEIVQTAGRDAAIHVLQGIHSLKRNLQNFMREKQEEGVNVITAEHVTSFFDKMKRSRTEEASGDDF